MAIDSMLLHDSIAGLVFGALEDNDDNDDTATGNCEWVLSFRDKHKLNNLAFKPAASDINASKSANQKQEQKRKWEKKQLMLMQQHFAQLLHLSEVNFSRLPIFSSTLKLKLRLPRARFRSSC